MSLAFYKVLHLLGAFLLFSGLGGLCVLANSGSDSPKARKLASMLHGISLLIILVGGFGALAKLGFGADIPAWIWIKVFIWIALGAAVVIVKRAPQFAIHLLYLLPVLGAVAGYAAIYHVGSGG